MATRLYLRNISNTNLSSSEQSAVLPVGTGSGVGSRRSLKLTKGSTQTDVGASMLAQTAHQDKILENFGSDALAAQTIPAATWTLAIATSEGNAQSNQFTICSVYVWRPSTSSVVGYIYDSDTTLGVEYVTTEDGQVVTFSGAAVTCQDGDILVLEHWIHAAQSMATAYATTLFYDGTTDVTDSTTADAASYLETPDNLTFSGGGAPPLRSQLQLGVGS